MHGQNHGRPIIGGGTEKSKQTDGMAWIQGGVRLIEYQHSTGLVLMQQASDPDPLLLADRKRLIGTVQK